MVHLDPPLSRFCCESQRGVDGQKTSQCSIDYHYSTTLSGAYRTRGATRLVQRSARLAVSEYQFNLKTDQKHSFLTKTMLQKVSCTWLFIGIFRWVSGGEYKI